MSIILEPDDVDDGYFTPVASTTLASIFKEDSSNDAAVNASLKYKPPLLKKPEESSRPEDSGTSQCMFSSSVIAYEWVRGAHKCKGKVGFAVMKIAKTGLCKMILYSPDKSTLSCTTITPQLEVTVSSGAMIAFYDDQKKYWGLCFNDKNIEGFKEQLKKENVAIKPYINPDSKPEIEIADSLSDSTEDAAEEISDSSITEDSAATPTMSQTNKASILNRIANVGHAILPSLPVSPKKTMSFEVGHTTDLCSSVNKLNVLPDVSIRKEDDNLIMPELTKSIANQTGQQNVEANSVLSINKNNKIESGQTSVTTIPLINNQIFTYVNGYMVPLHMQVPVLDNVNADTCAEIEHIIHKLTNLKNIVRSMEVKQYQNNDNPQSDQSLRKISDLEQSIREKDDTIRHLEKERRDLTDRINYLNDQIEKTTQNFEKNKNIPDKEANMHLNRKVKTLMNNTFHSLASNFDDEANYTGNYVKGILAAVIKNITIESLVHLFPNDASISTTED